MHVMASGVVLFHLSGNRTDLLACGNQIPTRWAFDGKTAAGQARLSLLLTAYASGKPIRIYGVAACPDWPDTENYFYN